MWYQNATFYEIPVHAFYDSNGDGLGDIAGITAKLDYLEWLGVDCLWLLPFYPSPMVDGGYDVSDFTAVREEFGTMDDVRGLLAAAHARDMRVIGDVVVNHTSDQHPWFQEARRPGSSKRDWYVWSDTPERYSDARVIFIDTYDSNWSWDEAAGAYYWHRFYAEQPDLNFDNPEVQEAVKSVIRFWLDLGFDGLRIDAIPYLYERDGTNCENLPETHAFLKEVRAMIDDEYDDRMMIAEANQRAADVVAYFGDGDEFHMAYNFPVMPTLYLALKREVVGDIVDTLAATPPIPATCQWGVFLRNHDELTLEMVTSEDRQFMYEQYAPAPAMRRNLGIRRRLAPLLDNERSRIELLYGILMSLPGSPFLYYGDEIGMGDDYLLDDRDGVRTPMQWAAEPGGGFSSATSDKFYLPLVSDPAFAIKEVNVKDQQADDESLLHFVRDLITLRRENPTLGTGTFELVEPGNPAVLAYVRREAKKEILVLGNFSSAAQTVNLAALAVTAAGDLVSGRRVEGEFELAAHEFVWLSLR